ncbi:MAG: methyltransferase domain-containing protein [Campylobacterota bacterium]|nr:methyltransferase domain-containing protein [Campylobacterota bacterium]
MNKLNKELVKAKKRLVEIDKEKKSLEGEYKYLQNKIHLYFDSFLYDTSDAEEYIINHFWQNATYSSDFYNSVLKQNYTKLQLSKITDKYCTKKKRALDVGCGNGMYTEHLATIFSECVGLDMSVPRIKRNTKNNKLENVTYLAENFIFCDTEKLGKYDLIFAADLGMYSHKKYHKSTFKALLRLLNDDGVLVTRESTTMKGSRDYKSSNYVAYYRNRKYYKKGIYKKHCIKSFRDCSYNIKTLDKYFCVFPKDKEKVDKNPALLDKIVKNYVSKNIGSNHYYIYKR